jgi:hypothetical protein
MIVDWYTYVNIRIIVTRYYNLFSQYVKELKSAGSSFRCRPTEFADVLDLNQSTCLQVTSD